MILYAETLLRAGDNKAALDIAGDAVTAADQLPVIDPARERAAQAVAADISHHTGQADAVTTCTAYLAAVTDPDRPGTDAHAVIARALHAAAVYHLSDCRPGRRLLTDLLTDVRHHHGHHAPLTGMLDAGLDTMRRRCAHPGYRPHLPPPPAMPGGVLHPDPADPDPAYLAHRILVLPGRHGCTVADTAPPRYPIGLPASWPAATGSQ